MERVPPFNAQQLTAIAKALGDTEDGLTGTEIAYLLGECRVPDTDPTATKWKRIFNASVEFQNQRQFGNHIVVFINKALSPVRFTDNPVKFRRWRDRLNPILAFSGMSVREDGKVRWVKPASSLDEAMARANRLQYLLESRGVHSDVLRYCKAELLQENYFHAVLEATKSVAAKVREMTGHPGDGAPLIQAAFGGQNPPLALSDLRTESQRSEQSGFVNLLVGLFGAVRNPLAHSPKIEWAMNEQDALDILTLVSLVHRKLDQCKKRP
jgi:uncharacterized protein (TIGR02391 family)